MKRAFWSSVAIAAIALVAPRAAGAASIQILDVNPNDTITFILNDFEGGFTLDGVLVQSGLNHSQTVTVPEFDAGGNTIVHTFSGHWITGGLVPISALIAFAEAGISPSLGVSDILSFGYSAGGLGGNLEGFFMSDKDGSLLALPTGATIVSEASPFVFNNGNITASAVSDVDPVPQVPEPASLLLLATGLAGAGLTRWRKR